MRTETDPIEDRRDWQPFGSPVNRNEHQPDEWQPSPDAPGVEYNWKTGKTRTNIPTPGAWVEDLAMQHRDSPIKPLPNQWPSKAVLDLQEWIRLETNQFVYGTGAGKVYYDQALGQFVWNHVSTADIYR